MFHVIFADSASMKRSNPIMAENIVATAALLCPACFVMYASSVKFTGITLVHDSVPLHFIQLSLNAFLPPNYVSAVVSS